jgi:transcription elongation GreA/GreB family factor
MPFKQKVYEHFYILLQQKITMLQQNLNDLKESGANETKSTAGDKHETALAMLQIEQANTRNQLQVLVQQMEVLQKINPELTNEKISIGSYIKTDQGHFFMSVALGKAVIEGIAVFAISPNAPIGKALIGLQVGASLNLNNKAYIVEAVF